MLATDGATLSSSTPPSADPAIAQASAKDLYLSPNSGLSLGGPPAIPDGKIGDRSVEVPIATAKKIISQSRDGEIQEYLITPPSDSELEVITGPTGEAEPAIEQGQEAIGEVLEIDPGASPSPEATENDPEPNQFLDSSPIPATEENDVPIAPEVIELISDHQEFDSNREIVTATGNVTMRFANGLLLADRLRVNLPDRFAVAEGNVTLKRGEQILQGQRFEYFFVLNQGVIYDANGEIYQPSTARDFAQTVPTDFGNPIVSNQSLNDRLAVNQPVTNVVGQEGFSTGIGASTPGAQSASQTETGGQVNRLRFQAEQVDFDADGWRAKKVRITNDPFNPPELEVQAETADYYNVAPEVDELKLTGSRVLLDQTTSLPFQDRLTIDRRDRQPGLISIGYDGEDRGGLYLQGNFTDRKSNTSELQSLV